MSATTTRTIFVIEDEEILRELAVCLLEAEGYRVLTATTAAEAVAIWDADGDNIDLLVSDIIIPGESGLELARKFRKDRPDLRIVFITGSVEKGAEIQMFSGVVEALFKPYAPTRLCSTVRRVLSAG